MWIVSLSMVGQTFPDHFPLSWYDFNKSSKSYLRWINDDASKPSSVNDAIIFGTSVNASDQFPTDILRLTCAGVATFNSPFSGYSQTIELRNQGQLTGQLRAVGQFLDISAQTNVNIGSFNNPSLFQINDGSAVMRVPLQFQSYESTLYVGIDQQKDDAWIGTRSNSHLELGVYANTAMTIESGTRNVYIGLSNAEMDNVAQGVKSKYGLFVKKGILAEDYAIGPVSTWADFVFDKDYDLKSLEDVQSFIDENGHLPSVPSAAQVAQEGYSQVEMNKILLQKIEELTLYIIKQDGEIKALKQQLGQ
ncbi:MAG: hypothetical protein NC453_16615 [Muribaculum sp.]|nr:hypothetical protein [Muribaculum sp.]